MRPRRRRRVGGDRGVGNLAPFHVRRPDGTAPEAGFDAIGRRATALAALCNELLRSGGVDAVNFAPYLASLCGRLAASRGPIGKGLVLHIGGSAEWSAALVVPGRTASTLGTAVVDLAIAASRGAAPSKGSRVLVQLMPAEEDGRRRRGGRLTVSASGTLASVGGQRCGKWCDEKLARSLVVQAGGALDRFVFRTGDGWCVRF